MSTAQKSILSRLSRKRMLFDVQREKSYSQALCFSALSAASV